MPHLKRTSSRTSPNSRKEKKRKSDQEVAKEMSKDTGDKWTLEELDLNKEIVSIYSLLEDKQLLVEKLFSILSSNEIKQMTPEPLKDIPLSILKDICIIQLKDNAILTDEEIMATLVDSETSFNSKLKTQPPEAKKKIEEVEVEDSALDDLVKKVENKEAPTDLEASKEEPKKEEEKKVEIESVEELTLPSNFHNRMKESFVEKGLCSLEDLDLDQPLIPLESLIEDRGKLWQLVQKLIPTEELFQLLPKVLKDVPMDEIKNEIHRVICDLPKELIEAVLNEANPPLNQESSLNLIKSDCSTKGVKSNNEEVESEELEKGGKEGEDEEKEKQEEKLDQEVERIADGLEGSEKKHEEEENPCNDGEDLVTKTDEKEGAVEERNPSVDEIVKNDNRQKSRLSPDEELAKLEKKAQTIREMLLAVEEEEARLRALMVHPTNTEEPKEENQEREQNLEKLDDTSCSPGNSNAVHDTELLINPVSDEDSLDRELKGSD